MPVAEDDSSVTPVSELAGVLASVTWNGDDGVGGDGSGSGVGDGGDGGGGSGGGDNGGGGGGGDHAPFCHQ